MIFSSQCDFLHQWCCTILEEGLSQENYLRLALRLRCGFCQITLTSCDTLHILVVHIMQSSVCGFVNRFAVLYNDRCCAYLVGFLRFHGVKNLRICAFVNLPKMDRPGTDLSIAPPKPYRWTNTHRSDYIIWSKDAVDRRRATQHAVMLTRTGATSTRTWTLPTTYNNL